MAGENGLPGAAERSVFTQAPEGEKPSSILGQINYRGVDEFGKAVQDTGALIDKKIISSASADSAQEGAQAVARDPTTGELSVTYQPEVFAWNKAYNDAASKAYVAQATTDVRQNAFAIAQQHPDDPKAFQQAFTAWSNGYIAKAPSQVRGDLSLTATQESGRFSEGIFQNKAKSDIADAQQAVKSEYDQNANQVYALARNGGVGTPDFQTAFNAAKAATDKMVANPLFGYSKADQAKDLAELQGGAQAEAVVAHAVDAGKSEGEQAGLDLLDKAIWDPKLNLTPAQRSSYASSGRAEIRANAQAARTAQTQHEQDLFYKLDDASAAAESTGDYSKVMKPNDITAAFGPYRGQQIVDGLNAKVAIYGMRKNVAVATPQQLAAMAQSLDPGKAPTATAPAGGFDPAWQFTLSHEGGYNPHDANGAPVNFGINQAAHPEVDVSKLTPETAKPIAKSGYWDKIGGDNLPANMQAAAFDTAYIFGPDTAKAMVAQAGGDPNKLIDLREQSMQALIAKDPAKFGKYQQAWNNRNDDLRALASGTGETGTGFAVRKQEYDAFVQAVQQRNKALASDPSGYVTSARPDIAQSLSSEDPATVQKGVRSLVQVQNDMGVTAPKVLSKGQAQNIIQMFDNPQDPTKSADSMNGLIDSLGQRYGSYFPQVMKELQGAGLPPEANALYQTRGMGGVSYRMATAINSMHGMGGKSVNENRDAYFKNAPNNSEIGKQVPAAMDDYVQSFRGNPEGPQQLNAALYANNLYARQISYEGTSDPTAAAAQAHKDLILSRYHFTPEGYRIPTGMNDSLISRGANMIRGGLASEDIEPIGAPSPGVPDSQRQQMSRDILKTRGVWVTRSDDKGLTLVWPSDSGYRPARTADGHTLNFSWSQLQQAGQAGGSPVTVDQALSTKVPAVPGMTQGNR